MITIKGLFASCGGEEILHGIDAEFPEGKISVLIGPNGCGKSTTIRSILGLVPEISGRILLDGTDLRALSPDGIARHIAYLCPRAGACRTSWWVSWRFTGGSRI